MQPSTCPSHALGSMIGKAATIRVWGSPSSAGLLVIRTRCLIAVAAVLVQAAPGTALAADPHQAGATPMAARAGIADNPYAGQQSRSIKALSDDDIARLENGDGMGMAKAAELNGYPGPRHVLAVAAQLRLTEDQANRIARLRDRMSAAARPLGRELIDRERRLDQLFASREITPERLTAETAMIGDIQGRLRAVHLAAHLATRAILSPEQATQYDRLRGYAEAGAPSHDRAGSRRH
jgi:Spy/CpxP family protein refolding chaperone